MSRPSDRVVARRSPSCQAITPYLVTCWGPSNCHTGSVPHFEPFRALRYAPSVPLDLVVAPPYDVLSQDERNRLAAQHERNIVHIDVPAGFGLDRYHHASAQLDAWIADGTIVSDAEPSFTIYRMRFVDESGIERTTVGLIGALEVVDVGDGGVLPHERTTPKDATDRLELTRATNANLSPVWGLSLRAGLTELLQEPAESVGGVFSRDGVDHKFERVTDARRLVALSDAVSAHPVLIADGHHRYSVSRVHRNDVRLRTGHPDTPSELVMSYVAELSETNLSVGAIHRMYPSTTSVELADLLATHFTIEPVDVVGNEMLAIMHTRGCLCLVRPDGSGALLTPRPDAFAGVRDLDSARLESVFSGRDVDVVYQHGVDRVKQRLKEEGGSAILIRPVSISEIIRTATEGLLMPPKSTFFTPKLLTGPVMRTLANP